MTKLVPLMMIHHLNWKNIQKENGITITKIDKRKNMPTKFIIKLIDSLKIDQTLTKKN